MMQILHPLRFQGPVTAPSQTKDIQQAEFQAFQIFNT